MNDKTYFVLATIFNHWKLIIFCVVMVLISSDVFACEEPISDAELLKYYKPCYGGWCLR